MPDLSKPSTLSSSLNKGLSANRCCNIALALVDRVPSANRWFITVNWDLRRSAFFAYLLSVKSALVLPATVTRLDEFFAPSCQATTV